MKKIGFDNQKYLKAQVKAIKERMKKFDKLYFEIGGKLLADYHSARVLPGYDPDLKTKMLQELKKDSEVIFCVSAKDIQSGKIMGHYKMTYDDWTLKSIDDLKAYKIDVKIVIINLYTGQSKTKKFKKYLEKRGIKVYTREIIKDYPNNLEGIANTNGFGKKPYIKTTKSLVIVTGAAPGSGKMATCLTMVYQDKLQNKDSGYAKFETFPIWNFPLNHSINVAYEASTADIKDYNLVDPYHWKTYKKKTINYNRDVENFIIIQKILQKIISKENYMNKYKSPTDMGINMISCGIINDKICRQAAKQELIRRYYRYNLEYKLEQGNKETVEIMKKLMKKMKVKLTDRKTVIAAQKATRDAKKQKKGKKGIYCGSAIELSDGKIVTGKNSLLLHSESAAILNAIKILANIPDKIHLISKNVIDQIKLLNKDVSELSASLNVDKTLIALAISAATNPTAKLAMEQLKNLNGCEMHSTHLPPKGDEKPIRDLGIYLTTDGIQAVPKLYQY